MNTHGSSISASATAPFASPRSGHSFISRNNPRSGRFALLASASRTAASGWVNIDINRWEGVAGSEATASVVVMVSWPDPIHPCPLAAGEVGHNIS